ncbi:hypothetical protein GA0070609_1538 [Micromonospora echinaurantiaca]|uniref:Winged helix DNA-binding domain-containing protein n=1 Tax=Micromonospora echinaurantiaca TaxID=47857 RepID=A0A1C5HFM8_9ACTN|nr:MarR family transcriptional regulator [Micromonospora echinaurantiaca]SCG44816.1 hypothetical protein GA0070609_1538 [Micromonospora echinaurantiaca]
MHIPFGPQLIGQTEKTLNAILTTILGDRLTEPQWVTLRLASLLEQEISTGDDLAQAVADRARFGNAGELVRGLTTAGLLRDGRVTAAGRRLVAEIQAQTAERVAPVWADLPADDVAAAARVLNEVLRRARAVLA